MFSADRSGQAKRAVGAHLPPGLHLPVAISGLTCCLSGRDPARRAHLHRTAIRATGSRGLQFRLARLGVRPHARARGLTSRDVLDAGPSNPAVHIGSRLVCLHRICLLACLAKLCFLKRLSEPSERRKVALRALRNPIYGARWIPFRV